MRIATVIGTVTLSRAHASLAGATLKLVVPLSRAELAEPDSWRGESLVAWDQLGAGQGSLIALSESAEAAQPFLPEIKPVDAYNAALIDQLNLS